MREDRIAKERKNEPNRKNHGGMLTLGWVREILEVEKEADLGRDKNNLENAPLKKRLGDRASKKESGKESNKESEAEEDW